MQISENQYTKCIHFQWDTPDGYGNRGCVCEKMRKEDPGRFIWVACGKSPIREIAPLNGNKDTGDCNLVRTCEYKEYRKKGGKYGKKRSFATGDSK